MSIEKELGNFTWKIIAALVFLCLLATLYQALYQAPACQIVVADKWRSTETAGINRVETVAYIVTEDDVRYKVVVDSLFHKLEIGESYTITLGILGNTIISVEGPIDGPG